MPEAIVQLLSTTANRLAALRETMRARGLDGYILPVNDWTLGEYPAAHARRLEWLSGFTGSAGWVAVTAERAALLADGRYTLQAAKQADGRIFETRNSGDIAPAAWLSDALKGIVTPRVGFDAWLFSHAAAQRMAMQCPAEWVADGAENLIDTLWHPRPTDPALPATVWPLACSGRSRAEKEAQIAEALRAKKLDAFLLTNPESPCWLLNLRGSDGPTTPQLNAMALVRLAGENVATELFVAPGKISADLRAEALAGVEILPESALPEVLGKLKDIALGLDPAATPRAATLALEAAGVAWQSVEDPCLLPRAVKHPVEQEGMREAHRRDGAALAQFFHWLDTFLAAHPPESWPNEVSIGEEVRAFRATQADFWGPSFDTIAGFGPNGAIVHYRAEAGQDLQLAPNNLLLLDSGGQYTMGTTDITRTLAIGEPSPAMRAHYTAVLAGHIRLGMAKFPRGTAGSQLDTLARAPLWQMGLDYDHGTGHGVGTFLNVHEGPQRISKRAGDHVALQPGMVLSNEPGYYKAGEYGIRIENLVLVVECLESEGFLRFETLTCAPYARRLIEPHLLSADALDWLNAYHHWVLDTLKPRVEAEVAAWLAAACAPIGV